MNRKKEAGQALILALTGLSIVLMGFAGLGIDVGYMRYEKRLQQTAADSAAIAGASNVAYGGVSAGAIAAATSNGFKNGVNNVTVTVNNPPTSGPHNGNANYVEVLVAAVQPTFFMRVLGINSEIMTARAVATNLSGGPGSGCLYTLGNSGNGILMNGVNETINAPSCGIVDDANLLMNGSSDKITAGSIGVSGSSTLNGSVTASPTPVTGIPAASDPLASLAPPSSGCAGNQSFLVNGTGITQSVPGGDYCNGITINGSNDHVTLNPGVIGGITINGSSQNVTFNQGLYVLTGNIGFIDNGSSTTISGTGITFYAASGPITLNGNSLTANLSAPTTGADAGMLFWQAPTDTNNFTINGNNSSSFNGIVYVPRAQVTINGSNGVTAYFIVVTKSLLMNGSSTLALSADTSGLVGGSPIKNVVLVE